MFKRSRPLRWSRDIAALVVVAITGAGCSNSNGADLTTDPPAADTTRTVAVSGTQSTSTSTMPSQAYDFDEVSELMDRFVVQRGLAGAGLIVVEQDDGIVLEEYWGEFDAERTSLIASASKMISAGVLLRLDDGGLLDIDAPVADVVDWGPATPRSLQPSCSPTAPASLVSSPTLSTSRTSVSTFQRGAFKIAERLIFTTTEDDADVIPPDTSFRYGGGQWQVAGAIAEVASGQPWAELIDETYIQPCGLEPGSLGYSNYISLMGNGIDYPTEFSGDPSTLVATDNPNVEAGAYATPRVFAEVLMMYLRGGECGDGHRVLSQQAIDRMVDDRVGPTYGGAAGQGLGYGLGWWIDRRDGFAYSLGAYGASPTLDLNEGFGYYVVLEANDSTWQALAEPLHTAIETTVLAARN